MPPVVPRVVAAATEYRLSTGRVEISRQNNVAATDLSNSVRLHGDLILEYVVRPVGNSCRVVRMDPPRRFDTVFYLYSPEMFFWNYQTCSSMVSQMLAQTPVVREFDLAADKWDYGYLPHTIASMVVSGYRQSIDQTADFPSGCKTDVAISIRVRALYSEPRALLLACHQTMLIRRQLFASAGTVINMGRAASTVCSVCMEEIGASLQDIADPIVLACSHVFHRCCLLPWFHRVSTCPTCRSDMIPCLLRMTRAARGNFPGVQHRTW